MKKLFTFILCTCSAISYANVTVKGDGTYTINQTGKKFEIRK